MEPAYVLSEFLVNGQPDSARFITFAGNLIATALKAATGKQPRVAACGESTALLCAEGKVEAAVEMERRFSQLCLLYEVDILRGFPWQAFAPKRSVRSFKESAQSTQPLTLRKTRLPAGDRLN